MMISLDKAKCKQCGLCIRTMQGFCISEKDGYPVFDAAVCNACQKCVAICPFQAILVNGVAPSKIENGHNPSPEQVYALLERRSSIKHYQDKPVPRELIEKIVSVAKYAPNQNKNISLHVIDDRTLIAEANQSINDFVKKYYAAMFRFRPVESLIRLFYRDIGVVKKKMEIKKGIHENTQVVIVASGDKKKPVTESSAHYMLATMMFMAETLGIGNCLVDSVCVALRTDKKLREKLKIREDVLGALVLGYSSEKIVNIPRGYEVDIDWNAGKKR